MTAGLYTGRALLKTRLLERLAPGGQMLNTDWVDNYPGFPEGLSGFELVDRMRKQAERFEIEITTDEVVSLERNGNYIRINTAEGQLTAKTVVITSGAHPVKLGVPGELELAGKGVSYCATCDGPFYRGVETAVVGGGDSAVEEAIFLTRFSSKIHLFHRRDELRATGLLRQKVLNEPKIEIHWSSVLTNIKSDDSGMVNGLTYKDLKTGQESDLAVEGVFFFVGQKPNSDYLKGFVDLDEAGYVITDSEMATSVPGVWAAGDVRAKKLRQISTAVGEGATAGWCAEKYIEEHFSG